MLEAEFEALLRTGERPSVEFKSAAALSDQPAQARIARALMAMTNTEDGGMVVVGVGEDNSGAPVHQGLTDEQLRTWQKRDHVFDQLGSYAVPWVNFEVDFEPVARRCVVLHVSPFAEIPVICRKGHIHTNQQNGNEKVVLRSGGIYTRSFGTRPASKEAAEPDLIRAVLQVAIRRGSRKFVEDSVRAGTMVTTSLPRGGASADPYAEQRKGFKP